MQRRKAISTIFGLGSMCTRVLAADAASARSEAYELQSRNGTAIQTLWGQLLDMVTNPEQPETAESAETRTGLRFNSVVPQKENPKLGATAFYKGQVERAGIGTVKFSLIYGLESSTFKISWPEPSCIDVATAVQDLRARGWVPTRPRPDWPTATGWSFATVAATRHAKMERIPLRAGIVPITTLTFPNQFSRCVTGLVMFKLRS